MSENKGKGNAPDARSENGQVAVWMADNGEFMNVSVDRGENEKFRFSMNTNYFDVLKFTAKDAVDMVEGYDVNFDAYPTKAGDNTYPVAFYISGFKTQPSKDGQYTNHYARVEKAPLIIKDDRVIGYKLPVEGVDGLVSFMSNHKSGNEYTSLTAKDCADLAKDKELERGGFKFRFDGVEDKGKFLSAEISVNNTQRQGRGVSV